MFSYFILLSQSSMKIRDVNKLKLLFIYLFSNRSVQCWKSVQLAVKVGVHRVGKRGGIYL